MVKNLAELARILTLTHGDSIQPERTSDLQPSPEDRALLAEIIEQDDLAKKLCTPDNVVALAFCGKGAGIVQADSIYLTRLGYTEHHGNHFKQGYEKVIQELGIEPGSGKLQQLRDYPSTVQAKLESYLAGTGPQFINLQELPGTSFLIGYVQPANPYEKQARHSPLESTKE